MGSSNGAPVAHRRTYPLPGGFELEFQWDGHSLEAIWSPDFPPKNLAQKLLPYYRLARNDFLSGLGVTILLVEE